MMQLIDLVIKHSLIFIGIIEKAALNPKIGLRVAYMHCTVFAFIPVVYGNYSKNV